MERDCDALYKVSENFYDRNVACLCSMHGRVRPHDSFFATTHVFLSKEVIDEMKRCVSILHKTITTESFKKRVFNEVHDDVPRDNIDGGVIMSYDFHLDEDTPKLIEINTNAGGLFLNYEALKESTACCKGSKTQDISNLSKNIVSMFIEEFAKKNDKQLQTIAIVDERPHEQFLYPEFLICKEILEKEGFFVFVVDPSEITMKEDGLYAHTVKIDLIYNRLTDFYFKKEENKKLLEAEKGKLVVITPNSDDYKLFAHKINYLLLQDQYFLSTFLTEDELSFLAKIIPETVVVNDFSVDYLWKNRKKYFFKPYSGYGGKGAYNGRGLTKETWEHIKSGGYLAQVIISANKRIVQRGEEKEMYKFDIRAYTYKGEVMLFAARMYQGQTTNFRTVGGGFAQILIIHT